MALPASGILPVLPNATGTCAPTPCRAGIACCHAQFLSPSHVSCWSSVRRADPPAASLESSRRHYTDDSNFRPGLSTSGAHLPADGGMGRVHFAERRGGGARATGTRHIEPVPCAEEFRNRQKRHLGPKEDTQDQLLAMDRKKQVYNDDGNLLKYNQSEGARHACCALTVLRPTLVGWLSGAPA
jgi:hypothetical protein